MYGGCKSFFELQTLKVGNIGNIDKIPLLVYTYIMKTKTNAGKANKRKATKTSNKKNVKKCQQKLTRQQKLTDEQRDDLIEKEVKESSKRDEKDLTPKMHRFIHNMILAMSPGKAAEKSGYSPASASAIGSRLLKMPAVKKELNRRIKAVITRSDEKIAHMLKHLYICAYYDPMDILDDEGRLRGDKKKLGDLTLAITGIETKLNSKGDAYTIVKLANKERARDQLGKYLQMFTEKVELSGGLSLSIGKPPTPESIEDN